MGGFFINILLVYGIDIEPGNSNRSMLSGYTPGWTVTRFDGSDTAKVTFRIIDRNDTATARSPQAKAR